MLTTALNGVRPRRIIDCGTGTGRNLDWLQAFGDVVGIDRSPTGMAVARSAGRRVVRGVVNALPFKDGCADVATSFDVLYSLPDEIEKQALAEMRRVLAPGGIVLVNVAALDILHGSHSTLTMEVRRYTRQSSRLPVDRRGIPGRADHLHEFDAVPAGAGGARTGADDGPRRRTL